jgi:hypothetical protein
MSMNIQKGSLDRFKGDRSKKREIIQEITILKVKFRRENALSMHPNEREGKKKR